MASQKQSENNSKVTIQGFVVVKVKKNGSRSVRPYSFGNTPEESFKAVRNIWKVSKKELESHGYKPVPTKMEIDYSKY